MIRLLLLAALSGLTVNLPLPDAKIYFPDENIPIDPRGGYSQQPGQAGQRTYYTKTSTYRKGGGYQSPIEWPPAGAGSEHSYGSPSHHVSYSSYSHRPQHHSYSSHSYGSGGSGHQTYTSGQSPVMNNYESHSHYGGSHSNGGGSVEGQIEQVSHGSSHHGTGSQGSLSGPQYEVHNWQETGGHVSQHGQPERVVEEESHVKHINYGGQRTEGQIEHLSQHSQPESVAEEKSHGQHTDDQIEHLSQHSQPESVAEEKSHGQHTDEQIEHLSQHSQPDRVVEEGSHGQHTSYGGQHMEGQIEHMPENNQVDDSGRPAAESSYGQHAVEHGQVQYETNHEVKKVSAADIAAEEHHIIQEIEELAGITSSPEGSTKNPIAQQQEIIREIEGLGDPNRDANTHGNEDIRKVYEQVETGSSHGNHETTIAPVRHHEVREEERAPVESQTHHREVEETPAVKVTSDHGSLGTHHGSTGAGQHEVHAETREETIHHTGSSHKKATPDPLDLVNLYNDYAHGDYRPGHPKDHVQEPKKELKPEIKQAIDNIMRDWEVLPEREGKPQPPPRNYKITKHVKVTTTTHNNPVVVHPSQTITKTIKTHTFHPSSSHHQVVTHHINIAELLEQLRQLESSPHHRNVTWCEEKIKEFLIELNRKEESGIEINQSVQEETLHHILTQDQTITKEIRHEVGHDASGEVKEEPFVKKTVVELGLNEPTRPPSQQTHSEHQESGSIAVEEQTDNEPREINYGKEDETSVEPPREQEESHIITVTPSPHHVPPLESWSHQSHTSETKETAPEETDEKSVITEHSENPAQPGSDGDMEAHGSEPEGVTTAPVQPSERPNQSEIEEFRGETQKHDRPLPPNYKPRDRSEEETNESENREPETGNESSHNVESKEHKTIDDLNIDIPKNEISPEEGKEEHGSIENLNIDLPEFEEKESSKDEVKTFLEKEQAAGEENAETPKGHSNTHEIEVEQENHGGLDAGNEVEKEKNEGSYGHHDEHVVEEVNTGEHSGGANTEYVEETIHHSSEDGHEHSGGGGQTEYVEETVEHHNSGGSHGSSGGGVNTEYVQETIHHSSEDGHGHSGGGGQTEYVEETVEHHNSGGSHGSSGGGVNTEYVQETIHHSSGGSHGHSGGGSQTEYVEETMEHHNSAGNHEINYDQLIEELISLESLPGHQAIDKCEEKIRQFLEVLKRQQERGFDQNKVELERLRHLLEEIQAEKQIQRDNGVNPNNTEASTSFWKKIGRKIKTTFENAKTKAHDTVNGMMH